MRVRGTAKKTNDYTSGVDIVAGRVDNIPTGVDIVARHLNQSQALERTHFVNKRGKWGSKRGFN